LTPTIQEESNFNQLDEQEWLFMLTRINVHQTKVQVSKYMTGMFFQASLLSG